MVPLPRRCDNRMKALKDRDSRSIANTVTADKGLKSRRAHDATGYIAMFEGFTERK